MSKIPLKTKNNRGSTLVIVIVVVAFIAILGTAALTSAMLNLKMKVVDREAKRSFYTAEEAVDQLYAGIGKLSMENLNEVYLEQLAKMTQQTAVGSAVVNTQLDNEQGNAQLRKNYAARMVSALFETYGSLWDGSTQTIIEPSGDGSAGKRTVLEVLNSFIEDSENIRVKSVGLKSVSVTPSTVYSGLFNYVIEVQDCVIEYKSASDASDYFANVTIDCRVGLPDVKIDFTEDANSKLTTFSDYAIIGCNGIEITKPNVTVDDTKIYAGDTSTGDETGGLRIGSGASLNVNGASTVVSSGVVQVGAAGAGGAGITISRLSRLWCANLELAEGTKNSQINIEGSAFVKDDLTVDGTDNTAVINGNYIGWSYEGETTASAGHASSSAMIVNGTNCKLDMSRVTSLILGGRSYVDVGGTDYYMTGESISLRANQEIYLLPERFIRRASDPDKTWFNPVMTQNAGDVSIQIPSDFFGAGYLNMEAPVKRIKVGNLTYFYFNIQETYADDYVSDILNYDEQKDGTDVYRAALKNLLVADITELQQQSLITNTGGSTIYSNGALVNASIADESGTVTVSGTSASGTAGFTDSAEVVAGDSSSVFGKDSFAVTAMDLKYRFMMITQLLYEPSFYKDQSLADGDVSMTGKARNIYSAFPGTIVVKNQQVDVTGATDNVFTNFVNVGYLKQATGLSAYMPQGQTDSSEFKVYITNRGLPGNDVIYVDSISGNGHINMHSGLIITDGDVVVKQDFNGLILAAGTVTVDGTVQVRNTYADIQDMLSQLPLKEDQEAVKKFFKAWNGMENNTEGEPLDYSIAGITYKKIVAFNNWRKSEDSGTARTE